MRVATISKGGQISIPADIRHRWGVKRVLLIESERELVVKPLPDDPIAAVMGSLAGVGPTSDEARAQARADELEASRRKGWA
jgi:bifunctional DNA-binding transcriptional regulator/antitoxin component of YhaV-PrlF toxin-antitoxin module